MSPDPMTLDEVLKATEVVDAFLDSHRSPEYIDQPLANDWARVTKVCEEAGEVWKELSKRTGENYRKGVCATEDDLLGEMADCVTAAMLGIQHRTKDTEKTWAVVSAAFAKASQRVAAADASSRLDGLPGPEDFRRDKGKPATVRRTANRSEGDTRWKPRPLTRPLRQQQTRR